MTTKDKECLVCGKTYKYCGHCNKNGIVDTWRNTYCSKECREIFKTCSNYEGNLISIEDAYNKLIELNVDVNKMKKSVRESVNKIMEYKPISKEIVTEDVIEEQPRRRRRRKTKSINE